MSFISWIAAVLVFALGQGSALAAPMIEIKGVKSPEGCRGALQPVSERLVTCSVDDERIRIWCPNGKVFERDGREVGIAVARSICELNQLPG